MIRKLLTSIPYTILIPIAVIAALAPFQPEPHLMEKLRMLSSGTLNTPLDIFDLLLHSAPALLLLTKFCLGESPERGTR